MRFAGCQIIENEFRYGQLHYTESKPETMSTSVRGCLMIPGFSVLWCVRLLKAFARSRKPKLHVNVCSVERICGLSLFFGEIRNGYVIKTFIVRIINKKLYLYFTDLLFKELGSFEYQTNYVLRLPLYLKRHPNQLQKRKQQKTEKKKRFFVIF